MNVLIIGNGGREHALAWKIGQSPEVSQVYCAPGNPGTLKQGVNVPIQSGDIPGLLAFARQENIDLTVVGPEAPLVNGIVDAFETEGLRIFGPSARAARLEGSKVFSKNLMKNYNIPTAGSAEFTNIREAEAYLREADRFPLVLKADGLAAGKGVIICDTREQALQNLKMIMEDRAFGEAGHAVVVEAFLRGEEASVFALCDGKEYLLLPSAQDHKKVLEGDRGKNTGGMGAYSPAPVMTAEMTERAERIIIGPTLEAMMREKAPYRGLLYFGLMIVEGEPFVLEYNCRFGDPETEAVLPLLESDLVPLLEAAVDGAVGRQALNIRDMAAIDVVLASGGYPDHYEKHFEIRGLDGLPDDILVFHAGTSLRGNTVVTSGGRVLNVVALGNELAEAKDKVYKAIEHISFDNMYYRRDIGFRAIGRLK